MAVGEGAPVTPGACFIALAFQRLPRRALKAVGIAKGKPVLRGSGRPLGAPAWSDAAAGGARLPSKGAGQAAAPYFRARK